MKPAITIEGLSKEYLIGSEYERNRNFQEMLMSSFKAPFKRFRRLSGSDEKQKRFWALKDIAFDVQPGEIVGVIGRNGAGKSTLLKVLSRITTPTHGKVSYRGRLASLLEIGTGFHGELTGRENIYLNGAILGMKRQEIRTRFDEIVDFAGVEKFLDTPVKRYSSGMVVRLAFSVAAHLDPDILLVDEVLAVGDTEFQAKCLGRIQSISESEGKTVIFVSHNLDAVNRICSRGVNLSEGEISFIGDIDQAIDKYLSNDKILSNQSDLTTTRERWGNGKVRIAKFEIKDVDGNQVTTLQAGRNYRFEIYYSVENDNVAVENVISTIEIIDNSGATVLLYASEYNKSYFEINNDRGMISCTVEDLNLTDGDYGVTLYLGTKHRESLDHLYNIAKLRVIGGNYFGTGHPGFPKQCKILSRSKWDID